MSPHIITPTYLELHSRIHLTKLRLMWMTSCYYQLIPMFQSWWLTSSLTLPYLTLKYIFKSMPLTFLYFPLQSESLLFLSLPLAFAHSQATCPKSTLKPFHSCFAPSKTSLLFLKTFYLNYNTCFKHSLFKYHISSSQPYSLNLYGPINQHKLPISRSPAWPSPA